MTWQVSGNFTSSNVAPPLRYNTETRILEVRFNNGGIYHYYDVPAEVWADMQSAESKGQFLAQRIKGKYRYSKV